MNPLSQDQMNAMTQAGQNVPTNALSDAQLKALLGASLTPDQSATVLGHANGLMSKNIGSAGQTITGNLKSNLGALGSLATGALPTIGAIGGGIGGAAVGGLAGIETGPGALATAYAGGVAGSGLGASAGEALKEKLQGQTLQPGQIAEQGVLNAGLEAVGGPIASLGGKLLEKTAIPVISTIGKGLSKVGEMFGGKPAADAVVGNATDRLASTAETMTKGERENAILQGRMTPGGKYVPSETEQRAAEIMAGKTSSNPVKTIKSLQNEIATRGQEAETHLEQNPVKITNQEDASAFATARNSSEKYMTSAEANAYDEQVGVFQKILKGYTQDGGYTTANYYKALKEYEGQVTANLPKGKDALLVPGGSARIQAAKDVRGVVRNMVGEKNPEFKGKMYDLASLYDSLDNVVSKAEQGGNKFSKRYPFLTGVAKTAGGIAGYEEAKKIPVIGDLLP